MTTSEFGAFVVQAAAYVVAHPEQRRGQAYFNALSEHDAALAADLSGTHIDPFHDDERVPAFMAEVADRMSK